MIISKFAFCLLLLAAGVENLATASQEVPTFQTSVEVRNPNPQIAESFDVLIQLTAPAGTRVEFPHIASEFGPFEVLHCDDLFDLPDQENAELRTWTRLLTLETLHTGQLEIPAMDITVATDSDRRVVQTRPQTVVVASVLENQVDPLKFRDIKDLVDIEKPPQRSYAWMAWSLAGAAATAIFCFALLRLAERRKWTTPSQWAIRVLESLGESGELQQSGSTAVFEKIETAIRGYLQMRFELPTANAAADKLTDSLRASGVPAELVENLQGLLSTAEQTKFAGVQLPPNELSRAVDEAICLIRNLETINLGTDSHATDLMEAS